VPETVFSRTALEHALRPRGVRLGERLGLGKIDLRGDLHDRAFMATCAALKDDYLSLRAETHALALSDRGRLVPAEPFADLRSRVRAVWEQTFGEAPV
jgi:hypothetical protein